MLRNWNVSSRRKDRAVRELRGNIDRLENLVGWLDCWKERLYSSSDVARRHFHEQVQAAPWKFPREVYIAVLDGDTWHLEKKRLELRKELDFYRAELRRLYDEE